MAKKQAKKKAKTSLGEDFGGSVYIDRRRPGTVDGASPLPQVLN
jgi:hypothetical protein